MIDIKKIADDADIIVNGYAFRICEDFIKVVNLHGQNGATVFSFDGQVLETSMDDIELEIAKDYFNANKNFISELKYA